MSDLPIRARYKHLNNVCAYLWQFSSWFKFLFLMWWSSKQGLETLYNCSAFFCLPIRNIFPHFSAFFLHVAAQCFCVLLDVCLILVIFQLLQQKHIIRTCLCPVPQCLRLVRIHFECIPSTRAQGMMLVHRDQRLSLSFPHRSHSMLFSCHFMSSTCTDRNKPCFLWTQRHSQFGTVSHSSPNNIFSNCPSLNHPESRWPSLGL